MKASKRAYNLAKQIGRAKALLIEAEERVAGLTSTLSTAPPVGVHGQAYDDSVLTAEHALENLKAHVVDARRRLFALEHPERIVRWVDKEPVLADDDLIYLKLKY